MVLWHGWISLEGKNNVAEEDSQGPPGVPSLRFHVVFLLQSLSVLLFLTLVSSSLPTDVAVVLPLAFTPLVTAGATDSDSPCKAGRESMSLRCCNITLRVFSMRSFTSSEVMPMVEMGSKMRISSFPPGKERFEES